MCSRLYGDTSGVMDNEAADNSTGVADSLNGETKPDPAKLAQTAIIKQVGILHPCILQQHPSRILQLQQPRAACLASLMLANINYPSHMKIISTLCCQMHIFNYLLGYICAVDTVGRYSLSISRR